MKKFLKNAVLVMLINCFILNIINLGYMYVKKYKAIQEILKILEQRSEEVITIGEEYGFLASIYYAGYGDKIEIQAGIIVLSIVFGIIIGMVITFKEKSKRTN